MIFECRERHPERGLRIKEIFDGRPLHFMDEALAKSSSEAVTILLAVTPESDASEKREELHEIVYICRRQELDLVQNALEPLIAALALQIDNSLGDISELIEGMLPEKFFSE
jgi:hypothetical protein